MGEPPIASGDPILDRLATDALKKGMEIARKDELRSPVLALRTEDGRTERLLLATPDVPPDVTMKLLLHAHRATHAALCFEGWIVEAKAPAPGPEYDAWVREALRGRRPDSDVPPSRDPHRFDALTLMGQVGAVPAGPRVQRLWRIAPGTPRTFALEGDEETWWQMPGNFWPMFVGEDAIRQILARHPRLLLLLAREDRRA